MRGPDAHEIAEKLAERAEAVCRTYLPRGRKTGNYWMVGDATGAPGQSMYVRLRGPLSGKGAAGKWSDAATGEHGNLLDIIRTVTGLAEFRQVLDEASRFLALPAPSSGPLRLPTRRDENANGRALASRVFTSSRNLAGSPAERYLKRRGIALQPDFGALRFHPRCFHSANEGGAPNHWPALVASVTTEAGDLTGIARTYLARDGLSKAPVEPVRKAKGDLLGNGIRFGAAVDIMAVGEGIETTLSLRALMPALPMVAATSSNHLSALHFPASLKCLLVIRDNDHAGDVATDALFARGRAAGVEVLLIDPELDDLNSDLVKLGPDRIAKRLRQQLPSPVIDRFLTA